MRRILILLLVLTTNTVAWAESKSPTVAVAPFVINSQQSLPKVRSTLQKLLVDQLSKQGVTVVEAAAVNHALKPGVFVNSETQARSLGRHVQADYVIYGSFNKIGNSISIDASLVNVAGVKKTEVLVGGESGMENLALAANKVVEQAASYLLAKAFVTKITVQGNERIGADAIKAVIKSRVGELLRPAQVSKDIRAIYRMGYFEKVEAEVHRNPSGGKILTFVVKENPTVVAVKIKGNKHIKDKDIRAAITVKPYTILKRDVVTQDVQKILKLYHQKGYYNAEVKSSITFPQGPRKAVVTFDIKEYSKVYIKSISFIGNKHFSAGTLRGVMQTKEKSILSWFTDRGILQKDILNTDIDRLTVFYHDRGFMDAVVGNAQITYRKNYIYITIPIEEGHRYRISRVAIGGVPQPDQKELRPQLKVKPHEFFSQEKLRDDLEYLTRYFMNRGYAHAEVNPHFRENSTNHTTSITYQIVKGNKFHIGRIYITGNTKTRDDVIRRQLQLVEGATFSAKKLEQSADNLRRLDFFKSVEVVPVETSQPNVLNLHVKVKEKRTGTFSVGGGYGSTDGLFTTAQIAQRNLFGRALQMSVTAFLAQNGSRYMLSFTDPWLFGKPIRAGIELYDWLQYYPDFYKDAVGFRLSAGHYFGNYSRISCAYRFEDAKLTDVVSDATSIITSQEGRHILSAVSVRVQRDTRDNPFMPSKGSINSVSVQWSTPLLGSQSNFIKSEVHSGWYYPLYWKFVGHLRGEFGYIKDLQGFDSIPIYDRFFLGGIDSLRGYKWGTVGPRDANGNFYGGTKYVVGTAEVLFPLAPKVGMRGLVFFDAGNAYLSSESIDPSSLLTDVGAGIQWESPMGPLRLEWGYNLNPEPGEASYQWQFSAGAYF